MAGRQPAHLTVDRTLMLPDFRRAGRSRPMSSGSQIETVLRKSRKETNGSKDLVWRANGISGHIISPAEGA